jgi:hypothetical protein
MTKKHAASLVRRIADPSVGARGVPSLRECVTLAKGCGVEVKPVRRTGELDFRSPHSPRRVRVNARRTDGTPELVRLLAAHLAGESKS